MRLFIAINFRPDFKDSLIGMQSALKEGGISGNFTRAENLHMTLAFIGDYGNPDEVLDVMESLWFKPIPIKLEGLQFFRDMVFARIEENRALFGFVKRLRRALAEADIPFDRKRFSPHITLVRRAVCRWDEPELPDELPSGEMVADRVSLMLSERGKHGMIYTELGGIE